MTILLSPQQYNPEILLQTVIRSTFATVHVFNFSSSTNLTVMSTFSKRNAWYSNFIIDDYMRLLVNYSKSNVYAFNTDFINQLLTHGFENVKKNLIEHNIFSKQYLFLPTIVCGCHWILNTVHIPSHTITQYDSLYTYFPQVTNTIATMLKQYTDLMNIDPINWTIVQGDSPYQENGYDCGAFVLEMTKHITMETPFNFNQKHMSLIRIRHEKELRLQTILPILLRHGMDGSNNQSSQTSKNTTLSPNSVSGESTELINYKAIKNKRRLKRMGYKRPRNHKKKNKAKTHDHTLSQ